MSPIHLTKDRVERVIEGLSPSCRREIEAALDSQLELESGCKQEIQRAMSGFTGINIAEGVSKPMKMHKKPSLGLDPTPPPEFAGQEPNNSNPIFDFFAVLATLILCIFSLYLLFFKKNRGLTSSDTPKKLVTRRGAQRWQR